VRLLDAQPLRDLSRPQRLLPPAELVLPQLLQPVLRDLRLDVLALRLAVLPVLLQDHQEVLHRAFLRGAVRHTAVSERCRLLSRVAAL